MVACFGTRNRHAMTATIAVLATAMGCWLLSAPATAWAGASATPSSSAGPPTNYTRPAISGTAEEGWILTEIPGTWSGPRDSVEWERCTDPAGQFCAPIPGAHGPRYVLGAGDVGNYIVVVETASNSAGVTRASSAPTAQVVPAPVSTAPAGTISSTMSWTFSFTPAYTKVVALTIHGLSHESDVVISCHGRGCPFGKGTIVPAHGAGCWRMGQKTKCEPPGQLALAPIFGRHPLGVGTRLKVAITRAGWIGKLYRFTIRPKAGPRIHIGYLSPG